MLHLHENSLLAAGCPAVPESESSDSDSCRQKNPARKLSLTLASSTGCCGPQWFRNSWKPPLCSMAEVLPFAGFTKTFILDFRLRSRFWSFPYTRCSVGFSDGYGTSVSIRLAMTVSGPLVRGTAMPKCTADFSKSRLTSQVDM